MTGTSTRARAEAVVPQRVSDAGSIGLALFWFGFEVSNAIVFGRR